MSLESDALLAVTGIFPKEITADDQLKSLTVPDTFARRLRAWVGAEDPTPFKYRQPPDDMEAIFAKVALPPSQVEVETWLGGLGMGDLALDYYASLSRARELIKMAWPKISIDGPAGPRVLPLSLDDAEEMWSLVQVLDDPMRIIEEMGSQTLTPAQARVFRETYRDLYGHGYDAIKDAEAERLAKQPGWEYGWEQASVLNTLRGLVPEAPPMLPPPAATPAPPPGKLKLDPAREMTQAEVSSAPRGVK